MLKRRIIKYLFMLEIQTRGISIRQLGNKNSEYYCGVCAKTIQRGLAEGYMSERTLDKLSDIIDVNVFIVDEDLKEEVERLREENKKLRKIINKINNLSRIGS